MGRCRYEEVILLVRLEVAPGGEPQDATRYLKFSKIQYLVPRGRPEFDAPAGPIPKAESGPDRAAGSLENLIGGTNFHTLFARILEVNPESQRF